jgi:Zn-dependent alcohol dehydrogenase
MASSGRIPMEHLVTARLPLERFADGVRLAQEGRALKVVFLP